MELINQRDADKLTELMTGDHVFIDSLGQSVPGRQKMRAGWQGYFAFCPDDWVSHEDIFPNGSMVGVFGAAGGTIAAEGKLPPREQVADTGRLSRVSGQRVGKGVKSLRAQQAGL